MYLITEMNIGMIFFVKCLNPYSNGTMYLIRRQLRGKGRYDLVLILILMEQCI